MDLLRKELAKRAAEHQKIQAVKEIGGLSSAGTGESGPKKKFLKRGELEVLKAQKEAAERKEREEKRRAEEDAAIRLHASAFRAPVVEEVKSPVVTLPKEEVVRRLRRLRKPITLFGEDDDARLARLKLVEDEGREDMALHGGHDITNVFLKERVEESRYDSDEEDGEGNAAKRQKPGGSESDTDSDGGAKPDAALGDGAGKAGDDHDEKTLMTLPEWIAFAATKNYSKEIYVAKFFRQLIREWEVKLAKRPEHVKRTAAGKVEAMTEKQCKDYMRPFFRRCKRKDVDADILEHIFRIVKLCEEREYLKAGDQYVQLAIGNAPWPMGVTSVGIHERAARTKIFANNIAHVMNDEYQRKYITSIKRLMTQCQEMYPTDPSKMLM